MLRAGRSEYVQSVQDGYAQTKRALECDCIYYHPQVGKDISESSSLSTGLTAPTWLSHDPSARRGAMVLEFTIHLTS